MVFSRIGPYRVRWIIPIPVSIGEDEEQNLKCGPYLEFAK